MSTKMTEAESFLTGLLCREGITAEDVVRSGIDATAELRDFLLLDCSAEEAAHFLMRHLRRQVNFDRVMQRDALLPRGVWPGPGSPPRSPTVH